MRTSALNVGDCLQVREEGEKAGGREGGWEGGSGSSVSSVMGHIPIQWTFLIKVYSQGGARELGGLGGLKPPSPSFYSPYCCAVAVTLYQICAYSCYRVTQIDLLQLCCMCHLTFNSFIFLNHCAC